MRVARGRVRKAGETNKTEARYGEHLERRRLAGEVLWYKFEALKVRLADGTFYTSDYAVMLANGDLEIHEVKAGRIDKASGRLIALSEDTSNVKTKIAAEMYPFRFILAIEAPKKVGGGFQFRNIGGD